MSSQHTGVMIALAVPSPERYALDPASAGIPEGAEVTPAPELHLTLAFLGPSEDLSSEQVEALRDACRALSEQETAPTALFPASAGVFPPDPDQATTQDGHTYEQPVAPFWLSPQPVDPFHALRESLMVHLAARGVADLVSTRHPVFNPHVTLAYVPLSAPPLAELPTPVPVEFSDLVLAVGGVWEIYPLLRASDASASPPPLTASVESALRHVSAAAPGFSADLLRAVYLRQRPPLSPVASRSDQALEAVRAYVRETTRQGLTAATLALPGWDPTSLGAKAPRLSDLINRAAIEPDPAQRALVLGRALALAARLPGRDGDAVRTRLRSLVADGNSSAARSARARRQLRDGKGRWIEMGGGVRFKVTSPGAGSQWYHGIVEGIDVPNGLVSVRLDSGAGENANKLVNIPNKMLDQPKALIGWRPKSAGKKGTTAPSKRPWSPDRPVVRGPGAAEAPSTWAGLKDWLSSKTKVTLDTETTGFDVEDGTDLPVQLAATRVRPDGTEDSFNTLVNPGKPIPAQSSAIHGITDDMVAGAPTPAEAFQQFQDWASQSEDNVLIAHNMNFDNSAVSSMSPEAKAYMDGADTLDTFRLARAAVPKTDQGGPTASHGLAVLAPAMGVDTGKSHTADADAKAASDLLPKLLDYAIDNDRPSAALSGLAAQNAAFDKDWPGYLAALASHKQSGAEAEAMTDPNSPDPDSEAISALENIMTEVVAKHPDAKVSGGNIVNLANDPNLKAAEADNPGQAEYAFTASRNPIKDAPVTLQASDIASVRESISRITQGNLPDGFDSLPEAQQQAAAKAAAGKAYSQLAGMFNERNDDPALRAAPGVKLKDIQEVEAPVDNPGDTEASDTELADLAMDSLKELQKRVGSKSKFASTRDRIAKSLTTAVDRFNNGDDDRPAFLENIEKIKHFANAQEDMYDSGFAQDNPELAHFSAFAEDLDNVSVAGGAGTSEDRLAYDAASKEIGISPATAESVLDPDMDWGQVTEAMEADAGAAGFFDDLYQAKSDKLNKTPAEKKAADAWSAWTAAYEKLKPNQAKQDMQQFLKDKEDAPARVGEGPLSAEEVQAAFDHEADKLSHPTSKFFKDGAKNALTNPNLGTDEKRRERLNKLVDQFKESADLPEESPRVEALRRAANGFGEQAEAPAAPAAETPAGAGTPPSFDDFKQTVWNNLAAMIDLDAKVEELGEDGVDSAITAIWNDLGQYKANSLIGIRPKLSEQGDFRGFELEYSEVGTPIDASAEDIAKLVSKAIESTETIDAVQYSGRVADELLGFFYGAKLPEELWAKVQAEVDKFLADQPEGGFIATNPREFAWGLAQRGEFRPGGWITNQELINLHTAEGDQPVDFHYTATNEPTPGFKNGEDWWAENFAVDPNFVTNWSSGQPGINELAHSFFAADWLNDEIDARSDQIIRSDGEDGELELRLADDANPDGKRWLNAPVDPPVGSYSPEGRAAKDAELAAIDAEFAKIVEGLDVDEAPEEVEVPGEPEDYGYEDTPIGNAWAARDEVYGAVADALTPEGSDEQADSFPEPVATSIDEFQSTLEAWETLPEDADSLGGYAGQVKERGDELVQALAADTSFPQQKVEAVQQAVDNFAGRVEEAADVADSPEPEAPEAPEPAEDTNAARFLGVFDRVKDIVKDEPALSDPLGAIGNAIANIGKELQSGSLSGSQGGKLLDGLVTEIDNLYADDLYADALEGTDAGDDLDAVRDDVLALALDAKAGKLGGGSGAPAAEDGEEGLSEEMFDAIAANREALGDLAEVSPAPKNQPGKKALAAWSETLDSLEAGVAVDKAEAQQQLDDLVKALEADSWGKKGKTYTAGDVAPVRESGQELVDLVPEEQAEAPEADAPEALPEPAAAAEDLQAIGERLESALDAILYNGEDDQEAYDAYRSAITEAMSFEYSAPDGTAYSVSIGGDEDDVAIGDDAFVAFTFEVHDAGGNKVGGGDRTIHVEDVLDDEGEPTGFARAYAYHEGLSLDAGVQGQGIGSALTARAVEVYRAAGIREIRLNANITVGSYAWARAGFAWDGGTSAADMEDLFNHFDKLMDISVHDAGKPSMDAARAGLDKMRRAIEDNPNDPGAWPTPFEVSMLGEAEADPSSPSWPGKDLLLDTAEWAAVLDLASDPQLAHQRAHYRWSQDHADFEPTPESVEKYGDDLPAHAADVDGTAADNQALHEMIAEEQAEAPGAAPEPTETVEPEEPAGWMGEPAYEVLRDEALLHAPLFVDDPDMTESDTELVRSVDQAFDGDLSADELAGVLLELADHVESGMPAGAPTNGDEAMWADKGQDAIDWLRGTAVELSPDAAVAEGAEPGPDLLESANPESMPEPGEFTGEGALTALEYTEDIDGVDLDGKLQQALDMRNEGELDNGELADAVEGIRTSLLERYGENTATKWIGDYLTTYAGQLRSMKDQDLPPADQEGEPTLDPAVTGQNLTSEVDAMIGMLKDEPDFESGQGAGWELPTEAIDAAEALLVAIEDSQFQLSQGSMTPQAAADQVDAAYEQLNDAYLVMTGGEGELPAFLSNAVYAYTESLGGGSGQPAAPFDAPFDPWAEPDPAADSPVVSANLAEKADALSQSDNPVIQAVGEHIKNRLAGDQTANDVKPSEEAEALGDFLGWAASGSGADETVKAEFFDAAEELDGVGDGPDEDDLDAMYEGWVDEVIIELGGTPAEVDFFDWLSTDGGWPQNDAETAAELWTEAHQEPEIPDTPEQVKAKTPAAAYEPAHAWDQYKQPGENWDGDPIDNWTALYGYATDYSDDINGMLRDPENFVPGVGDVSSMAKDLDSMMEHSSVTEATTTKRIAVGPTDSAWMQALMGAEVGKTIVDQGFSSTSKSDDVSDWNKVPADIAGRPQASVTFQIDVPAGTRAIDVNEMLSGAFGSPNPMEGEYELLLDRGTGFMVTDKQTTPDGRGIMLRVTAVQNGVQTEEANDGGTEEAEPADGAADDGGGQGTPEGGAGPAEVPAAEAGAGQLGELTDLSQSIHDVDSWEKVGGNLGGGSIGGTFKDADGNAYYVKKPDSPAHAHNEVLHSLLLRDLGINAATVELGTQNGQLVIVSKWVPGNEGALEGKSLGLAADKIAEGDQDWITKAYDGFTADAWLANWDAVGPKQNNIVVGKDADGNDVPFRIDGGGAMLFSGFGDPKGAKFGPIVTELQSMRDPDRSAGKLFQGMTNEQVKADAARLASLSPDRLMDLINASGHDEQTKADLFLTLSARQASILSQTGAVKPADPAMETVVKAAKKADAHKGQIETSAPNPEAADAIAAAETGTEPAQLWVGADGIQLKLGDKVVSAKDGAAGTVVSLSANGKYAKVLPAGQESLAPKDRKYIFRFPHTLGQQTPAENDVPTYGAASEVFEDYSSLTFEGEYFGDLNGDDYDAVGLLEIVAELESSAKSTVNPPSFRAQYAEAAEHLRGIAEEMADQAAMFYEDATIAELAKLGVDTEDEGDDYENALKDIGSLQEDGSTPAEAAKQLAEKYDLAPTDPNPFGALATDLLGKLDQFAFNNAGIESDGIDIGDNAYETYYSVLNGETSPDDGYDILTDMLGDAGESASPTAQADLQEIADGVKALPDLTDQEPLEEDEEAIAEAEAAELPKSAKPDPAGAQETDLQFHQMTANNMVPGMVNKKDEVLQSVYPTVLDDGKPGWRAWVTTPDGEQKKYVWKKYSGVGQWATPSTAAPTAGPAPEKTPLFVSGGHAFHEGDEVYAFHGWEQGPTPDMPIAIWRKGVLGKSEVFGGYQVTKENGTSLLLSNHEDVMTPEAHAAFDAEQKKLIADTEAAILENAGMEPGGPFAPPEPLTFAQQATTAIRQAFSPLIDSLAGYGNQDDGNDYGNDVSQTLDLLDDEELEPVAAVEDLKAMIEGLKYSTNEDGEELPTDTYLDFITGVQAMEDLVNNPFAFDLDNPPAAPDAPAAPVEEPLADWEKDLLGIGIPNLGPKYASMPIGSKPLFQMTDKVGQDTGPVVVQHPDGSLHGYTAAGTVSPAFTTLAKYQANPNWSTYVPGPAAAGQAAPSPSSAPVPAGGTDESAESAALDEIISAAGALKGFVTDDGTDLGELLENYAATQKGPDGDDPQDALALMISALDETGNAKNDNGDGLEAEPLVALGNAIGNLQNAYNGEAPTAPNVHPANLSANLSGPSQMGAYGQTMYVGTKVQSTTDGTTGTIIGFSPDGKYAKVMVPGQAKTKLRYPSKLKYDPNAGGAPAPGAAAEKPGIPGGTMLAPNSIPTPDPGVKYVEGASDPSSPWFGEDKKPQAPAAPETAAAQALDEEWFSKVEAAYQEKQGKPLSDSSKNATYMLAKNGSKPALDILKSKGWIDQELYDEAVQLIEFNLAETQAALDAHAAKVTQHQSDLAEWAKANGKTGVALMGFEAPTLLKLGAPEAKSVMNNLHKPANLTPAQKAAVQAQKSSSSWQTPLRKTLKKETLDPANVSQQVKNLDQAVQAAPPLSDDMVMVRTLTPTSFVLPGMTREQMRESANFPKVQGTVQIDWGFPESSPGSMEAGAPPGFQVGNVWMDILMPKGTRGVWTGGGGFSHTGERGFVAERGLAYYIHKAEWRTDLPGAHGQGKWYVQAEVLPKLGDYGGSYYGIFDPGAPVEAVVGTPNGLIEGGIAPVPGAPDAPDAGGAAPAGPAV